MFKRGDKVRLNFVDGYEAYLGLEGTFIMKQDNLYLVRFEQKIDGEDEFFLRRDEFTLA